MTQAYLWGGQKLRAFGKPHASGQPLAEVWEVSDRPEDDRVSIVASGPLAGKNLHELMEEYGEALLGKVAPVNGKFPLLIKLLDAEARLSLQVHPPEESTADGASEPKTECWLMLDGTNSNAHILAGLKKNVTQSQFETALKQGTLEPLLHHLAVKPGDCMFLPSGRLHVIDAGCLLLEVQQNSNTTYRVFDWNRLDPRTHKPRELHVRQALRSIDFSDTEPQLQAPLKNENQEILVDCPYFTLERWRLEGERQHHPRDSFEILMSLTQKIKLKSKSGVLELAPLSFVLIPASLPRYSLQAPAAAYVRIFIS